MAAKKVRCAAMREAAKRQLLRNHLKVTAGPAIQATLHGVSLLLVCSGIFLQEDLSILIGAGLWMVSSLMLLIHIIFVVSHKPEISTPHFG